VAAEDVDPSVGERRARIAISVVEHALRIAVLRKGRPVHGEVGLVQQGGVELAAVLEGVGVADVEQQLPFHRANRLDARRHALAQALAHQIAAVGEPLERVIRRAILPQAQERIEAVQDVPQGRIELVAGGAQCSAGDREVDQRGVGHVVGGVFRESGVKQDLGILRILLPYQTHMHRFGTLHRDQGGNLPTLRWRTVGIGIREHTLRRSARPGSEREPHQRADTSGCKPDFLTHLGPPRSDLE